jgi:G3E family GTPase
MLKDPRMPVDLIVLSGFLGSGKTTLLLDFLNQGAAADTGVIVNEVGEIGIDGAIVADGSDAVPMAMLANGCVCCSLRSGLVHTVGALLNMPRPAGRGPLQRIILETSGLSRPGPIIASLADPELAGRGLRLAVTSTYDCETGALDAERFDEAAAQLAAAQCIVFTKMDRVSSEAAAAHYRLVEGINPLARIVMQPRRELAVREAFAVPASDADPTSMAVQALGAASALRSAHPRIHVMTATIDPAATWNDLSQWLDDLAGFCGERLLRVKAIVTVADCEDPVLIQSVGTTFSAPRRMPAYKGSSLFALIARDIDAARLNTLSQQFLIRLSSS